MGSHPPSPHELHPWTTLARPHPRKHLLHHTLTHALVEKHILDHLDPLDLKADSLIYEWRATKRNSRHFVQILEMRQVLSESEGGCSAGLCRGGGGQTQLIVYTEHLHKLYEKPAEVELGGEEQLRIWGEVLEGVEVLADKLGYFAVGKDMVGYNADRKGKVWLNENYASNTIQYKRKVRSEQDRAQWEREVTKDLVEIALLAENQQIQSNFHFAVQAVREQKLSSFQSFRQFCSKRKAETQELRSQIERQSPNKSSLSDQDQSVGKGSQREVKSSTKDQPQGASTERPKKYVLVPVVSVKKIYPISEQDREYIDRHIRHTYHHPEPQPQSSPAIAPPRPNYVTVKRHTQSYINPNCPEEEEPSQQPLFTIC